MLSSCHLNLLSLQRGWFLHEAGFEFVKIMVNTPLIILATKIEKMTISLPHLQLAWLITYFSNLACKSLRIPALFNYINIIN
jgi:hypothetical protein